jgi:hypothetical protein
MQTIGLHLSVAKKVSSIQINTTHNNDWEVGKLFIHAIFFPPMYVQLLGYG